MKRRSSLPFIFLCLLLLAAAGLLVSVLAGSRPQTRPIEDRAPGWIQRQADEYWRRDEEATRQMEAEVARDIAAAANRPLAPQVLVLSRPNTGDPNLDRQINEQERAIARKEGSLLFDPATGKYSKP